MKTFAQELELAIRAQYPIIAVETYEWTRVKEMMRDVAKSLQRDLTNWNRVDGLIRDGKRVEDSDDPIVAMRTIYEVCMATESGRKSEIFILYDFNTYLENVEILERLRLMAPELKYRAKTIILVAPAFAIPHDLEKDLTILSMPLPTREELKLVFERFTGETKDKDGMVLSRTVPPDIAEEAAHAAQGLTAEEAYNAYIRAYLESRYEDVKNAVASILSQKEQTIRKGRI
ncbi:MAG TPA: hypothetical protein VMW87_05440, partial [Spirochaetia bacterium]|nr:hypothetical protein [Spirochaetia bacterium]